MAINGFSSWDTPAYLALSHFLSWSVYRFLKVKSNWERRPTFELTSSIKGEYIICKDLADFLPMGTTRSANGPTHVELIFPFACFPVLWSQFLSSWVTAPVVAGIKIVFLINPRLRMSKPSNIRICFLFRWLLSGLTSVCSSIRVDRKRLFMYRKGHLGCF